LDELACLVPLDSERLTIGISRGAVLAPAAECHSLSRPQFRDCRTNHIFVDPMST
jgi:hypothetical protein